MIIAAIFLRYSRAFYFLRAITELRGIGEKRLAALYLTEFVVQENQNQNIFLPPYLLRESEKHCLARPILMAGIDLLV